MHETPCLLPLHAFYEWVLQRKRVKNHRHFHREITVITIRMGWWMSMFSSFLTMQSSPVTLIIFQTLKLLNGVLNILSLSFSHFSSLVPAAWPPIPHSLKDGFQQEGNVISTIFNYVCHLLQCFKGVLQRVTPLKNQLDVNVWPVKRKIGHFLGKIWKKVQMLTTD